MNYEFIFVVFVFGFGLTLIGIVAIVFGKDDIAKTAVTALAQRFGDTIKAAGQVVKRLTPQSPQKQSSDNNSTTGQNGD